MLAGTRLVCDINFQDSSRAKKYNPVGSVLGRPAHQIAPGFVKRTLLTALAGPNTHQ